MEKHTQQCIALAGIAQAAFLVTQLARHGQAAQDKLNASLNTLFVTQPESTIAVYGEYRHIRLGLNVLEEVFDNNGASDLKSPELLRYLIGLVHLERKLSADSGMMDSIGQELQALQARHGEPPYDFSDFPDMIAELADIYQRTISTLPFRIQVKGEMQSLQNPQVANSIRATLLAGIRSAVLWRQLGGRRWHFLVHRKRIRGDISELQRRTF